MHIAVRPIARVGSAFIALAVSVLIGATLAVVVVERRISALTDMFWRLGWVLRGRPLAPGEADDTWLLEVEWRYALVMGIIIAVVGSLLWGAMSWRKRQGRGSAAFIGLSLCIVAAGITFYEADRTVAVQNIVLIGLLGAAVSQITFASDRAMTSRIDRKV